LFGLMARVIFFIAGLMVGVVVAEFKTDAHLFGHYRTASFDVIAKELSTGP
jgi:hypothetical protein